MDFICNPKQCSGCSACENICPKNAILMVENEIGFKYPQIDFNKCIKCGVCTLVCPANNVKNETNKISKAYAAYNKNEEVRMESSSGGVFTLLASHIILNGGIVFGACFDEKLCVIHEKSETIEELKKFRSSKYMQSDLKETYKNVKLELDKGREVLFTGTPCQVEGLVSFLRRDYENLYLQDLICHGVPSKKIFEKYLEYKKNKMGENIKKVSFRDKTNKGWNNYQVKISYENQEEYLDHSTDWYMRVFLSDIALRESCYNCKFKKKNRISDITLADFWGINKVVPKMNDEKGTSLVIIHSDKGKKIFEKIKDSINFKEVDLDLAISNNGSMLTSSPKNPNREEFLKYLVEGKDIEFLVKKYILNDK